MTRRYALVNLSNNRQEYLEVEIDGVLTTVAPEEFVDVYEADEQTLTLRDLLRTDEPDEHIDARVREPLPGGSKARKTS